MKTPVWISPETTSINRLPMLNIGHLMSISLDGDWNFQLLDRPDQEPSKRWQTIPVPGLWTMINGEQPFGDKPIYTNTQMPFDQLPPLVPEENPTGIYEREFSLPNTWKNKRVVLSIGGFESVAILSINGNEVGVAKDSRLAAEFDITNFLDNGSNRIQIKVIKWSDATFIEDQDQWWHGGITRSVKLYATEEVFIERLYPTPGLLADNKSGTLHVRAHINSINDASIVNFKLRVKVIGVKGASEVAPVISKKAPQWTEKSAEEKQAGDDYFHGAYWDGSMSKAKFEAFLATENIIPGPLEFTIKVPNISPWSAESPTLYDVEYELVDPSGQVIEITSQKIGFRRVEIKGNELLVNGQPVIFYGINRHDFNRETGRVLTRDLMRQDLLELKRWNFNAVRTSHYPNDPAFLDLCDELGFYVVGEANIESHAFQNTLCNDQKYLNAWVDRVARMIQRDIHHPSVVLWSLGNESGAGLNHRAAAQYARFFDPTRPLHYEGAIRGNWTINHDLTDVVCPMYPEISAIISYAKSKKATRPLIMCEYSHAMGNSNGTIAEYWDAVHSLKGLQGGFIWEMWDHGLNQRLEDGTIRAAYGGDYGEVKHDGNFVCDGMFFPDRSPKPALQEFKYIAAPVKICAKNLKTGRFEIFNKQFFNDLREFKLRYEITVNGKVALSGDVKLPVVKARKSAIFTIPAKSLKAGDGVGERFINFNLESSVSKPWSHMGTEVAWSQFALAAKPLPKAKPAKEGRNFVSQDGLILLPSCEVAPKLTLWRAPTDNDLIGHIAEKWNKWGLRELSRSNFQVTHKGATTRIATTWKTSAGITLKHQQLVESVVDGIRVTETVTLPTQLDDVARVGTNLELSGDLDQLVYFGTGPFETMPDRAIGKIHRWSSSVYDQYVPYVKPQENGGHVGVRWFSISNRTNHGVYFQLDKPRMVTVTPMRSTDLADATHNVFVNKCGSTVVTIDVAHRGVGTASCGPDTLDKYRIKPGVYKWSWTALSF
ncbi:MAG: glycoside hydrolase family 2 TIM barrel-domain containing protein [Actinomycetota bacterium]